MPVSTFSLIFPRPLDQTFVAPRPCRYAAGHVVGLGPGCGTRWPRPWPGDFEDGQGLFWPRRNTSRCRPHRRPGSSRFPWPLRPDSRRIGAGPWRGGIVGIVDEKTLAPLPSASEMAARSGRKIVFRGQGQDFDPHGESRGHRIDDSWRADEGQIPGIDEGHGKWAMPSLDPIRLTTSFSGRDPRRTGPCTSRTRPCERRKAPCTRILIDFSGFLAAAYRASMTHAGWAGPDRRFPGR